MGREMQAGASGMDGRAPEAAAASHATTQASARPESPEGAILQGAESRNYSSWHPIVPVNRTGS